MITKATAGPLAVIAGRGQFPLLVAEKARETGRPVVAAAHENETDPALKALVQDMIWVKLGQVQRMVDFFKAHGAREVLMAGGLTKERFFENYDPDERAIALLAGLTDFHDDKVLRAVAGNLEADGLVTRSAAEVLPEVLAPQGVLTKKAPDEALWAEINFGREMALELGRLDVGQCVVVKERIVLALEAIEGTDACIRRGAALSRGGAVVVKMAKPSQDLRFDLPTVGLDTIKLMVEFKAAALAVEAGKTLMFDQKAMLSLADSHGLVVVGLEPGA